jgi:signal transduction histidine kinase
MSDVYLASLLVTAGACIGFALHAANVALQTRSRRDVYLLVLALLEGGYCLVSYRYLGEKDGTRALPWGQSICAFTPYITYVFGELTMDLTERVPRWVHAAQRANLALTTGFAGAVLVDMAFDTSVVLRPTIVTDLASAHRHRLVFTPLGMAYLTWVAVAFCCFAALLFGDRKRPRHLAPMRLGSIAYFAATIADFGILVGARDGHFIQHLGFFALLVGCWRVLAGRFGQSLAAQRAAVERLEEQRQQLLTAAPMLHKQKLDSLGTLAAGVAHEINNPIGGILNYAHLLKRNIPPDDDVWSFADEIEREGKRVATIVRSLLHFGRADESNAVAGDVREVVDETLALVRTAIEKDEIAIRLDVEEELPDIVCRVGQLRQVLMNLVMNAHDALKRRDPARGDPKEITVRVGKVTVRGAAAVALEVVDTGDGFDAATADRVFDPFFTTKPDGEGVGLGLSISHGIVQAHGGSVTCESEPGRQTRFRVELPCTPPGLGL